MTADTKKCRDCAKTLPRSGFSIALTGKDGLAAYCKPCAAARTRIWYSKNLEYSLAKARARYAKRLAADMERELRYRRANSAAANDRAKKWAENNPERVYAYRQSQRAANPKAASQRVQKWREDNREKHRQQGKKYRQKNKTAVSARLARRRAKKKKAVPKWLTAIQRAQIREFYDIAAALRTQTGIEHHVDHIHPLQGKNFCGLHVPWNLQVLPGDVNIRKSNRLPL